MHFKSEKIRVGILGMGRASDFMNPVLAYPHTVLAAICDRIPGKATRALKKQNIDQGGIIVFNEYTEMLEKADLDVVIIGSGWSDHVPQSIMALERGIHVFSEVPVTVTLDQAKNLAQACRKSRAVYMMGENSCYHRHIMTVLGMVRDGLLGYIHYAEGEYIHDCRYLLDLIPWRREMMYSINGLMYMTHEIGPILDWIDWDRIVSVSAAGSGSHFRDAKGKPFVMETRLTMQCKTAKGRLIRLCQDFQSPCAGYHHRYIVQGVEGRYESRFRSFPDQIMSTLLPDENEKPHWTDLSQYEKKYLPDIWKRLGDEAIKHGHGGTDFIMMHDYLESLWKGKPVRFDVNKSLDMTLPGIMSVESLKQDNAWVDVPDPRVW
ncbi:MAG: Gfo/Idh/MocA family oxidoreductase [Bacillota bacterium]|nr:Gfo/Idh/MocA family oxidoreductase [Bacillota bacterium]